MNAPIVFIIVLSVLSSFPYALGAFGDLCFENVNNLCGLASGDPATMFQGILSPLETQISGFGFVIFWAGILAVVWFKTENIMIISLLGIFINATITGFSEEARGYGLLLLGVSNGLLIFQLIRQRITIFS